MRPAFRYTPGQFCELSIFGQGEAPFGIASSPTEEGFVRFTVKKAGVVTSKLHSLKPGDGIGMRGPLGNYFPARSDARQAMWWSSAAASLSPPCAR